MQSTLFCVMELFIMSGINLIQIFFNIHSCCSPGIFIFTVIYSVFIMTVLIIHFILNHSNLEILITASLCVMKYIFNITD